MYVFVWVFFLPFSRSVSEFSFGVFMVFFYSGQEKLYINVTFHYFLFKYLFLNC